MRLSYRPPYASRLSVCPSVRSYRTSSQTKLKRRKTLWCERSVAQEQPVCKKNGRRIVSPNVVKVAKQCNVYR